MKRNIIAVRGVMKTNGSCLFLLIAGEIENGVASVRPSLRATLSAADNSKRVCAVTVSGHEILMRIINVTALTERPARAGWFLPRYLRPRAISTASYIH